MKHFNSHSFFDNQAGFTLIEMLVVAAIIAFMSTALIENFSRTRIDLLQSTNLVTAAIRSAQSSAISSTQYGGYNPCGYGFHYIDPTHFAVYVGPDSATTDCTAINRNYQPGEDSLLANQVFQDSRVQFIAPFDDIYFEPPDPKTYLNNNATLNQAPITISIGQIGTTCPANCKTIYVYPSGNVETQ